MAGQFTGKVALVTGAGSGIGRASALAFEQEGAGTVVADISAEGGEETVRLIRAAGGEAHCVRVDVANADDVEGMVRRAVDLFGRLDYAHNNAGLAGRGGLTHECPEDVWAHVLAVNLTGVWLCMKDEIAAMLARGDGGAIVNTASVAGLVGGVASNYVASKHGVVGLTKNAALEYARRRIRVNAVCPGVIDIPMVAATFASDPGREARFRASEPIGRFGTPEDVAAAPVWLCSDAASFVTGVALPVDGGWVAQ